MPSAAKATSNEIAFTLGHNPYTYFHLRLTSLPSQHSAQAKPSASNHLDEITLRQYLTSALAQSFGITGSAVAIDLLKVDDREAWLRLQSEDADMLVAALSQWSSANRRVSLRIVGRASWLGGLKGSGGEDKLWSLDT